jgi:spore coat polysaccharide biosynthesis protein SpsF (cytidylyltransferase family)
VPDPSGPTVAVIQARLGSTRLPGKTLLELAGRPLIRWTIAAVAAVPGIDELVVATTDEPGDDALAERLDGEGVRIHRGPTHDVLRRVADAVRPFTPRVVLRQTGDNPFPDPEIMAAQLGRLEEGPFDYVGIAGLPFGIGAEAVRAEVLDAADAEATDVAEREHVLPFVYRRPERFRVGALEGAAIPAWRHGRYTVDTPADLAFAGALAERVLAAGLGRPPRLADLEAIVAEDPRLATMNVDIEQRDHRVAQLVPARQEER